MNRGIDPVAPVLPPALPHTEFARAKINLTLRVLGRRADGYHELSSLVAFAGIGDRVTLDLAAPAGVSVAGPFAAAITGENLATVALRRALLAMPDLATGHISIDKQLPVAGGIGGGSADAAAVLRLLQAANPADAARPAWGQLAAGLGADVPVCLAQQAAWIGGAGDRVALVHALPRMAAVLANAQDPVPTAKTAAVFRQLAARPFAAGTGAAHPERFTDAAALIAFVATHGNDLEPPARTLMPSIGATLAALAGCPGARAVRLSGAGPTCFALFEHADAARSAARRLALDHPGWWVRATELG